jgi:hypothetical protein
MKPPKVMLSKSFAVEKPPKNHTIESAEMLNLSAEKLNN